MVNFDTLCENYEEILDRDLGMSGERHEYFTNFKALWVKTFIDRYCEKKNNFKILDVGCGIGKLNKYLHLYLGNTTYCGIDISSKSIKKAHKENEKMPLSYYCRYNGKEMPFKKNSFDIAITAGLLHHVLPENRPHTLEAIYEMLKPGGYLFIFEHNIYNPFVQAVVKRCIIDKDASLISINMGKSYLSKCGLKIIKSDYIIFFPAILKWLRPLEKYLFWLALGAQYVLVGQKPDEE